MWQQFHNVLLPLRQLSILLKDHIQETDFVQPSLLTHVAFQELREIKKKMNIIEPRLSSPESGLHNSMADHRAIDHRKILNLAEKLRLTEFSRQILQKQKER